MALLAQEWTLEADIELASKYEWRGLQLDPGFNTQYAAYGSLAWDDLMLTAGVWSLTDLSSEAEGLPERWAFETSPWIEASVGGNRGEVLAGLTGYFLRDPEPGTEFRRGNTWEVYAGARGAMPGAPLLGEAIVYWDVDRVGGVYGEVAAILQIPVWVGLVVPIGSMFLEGRSGIALGQERSVDDTEPSDYNFAERGFTHLDISLRTTLLPVAAGPFTASLTIDAHWVRGLDPETKLLGVRVGGPRDRTRWWWGLGLRFTFPRCRPERELCQDL
ncbi:MAG: hypothetical protein IH921_07385 [Gemmatimonadetes bacterium]|nr:hypothetical protein [Gemmatimonadota bacterium]